MHIEQLNTTTYTDRPATPLTLKSIEAAMNLLPKESIVFNASPKRKKGLFERFMNKLGYKRDSEFIMVDMNAFKGINIYKWKKPITLKDEI